MTPEYIQHSHNVARADSTNDAKADAEADADMRDLRAKIMVENVRRMAALMSSAHIQTRYVEFPDEDHFSVVPSALGKAVPFALSDSLRTH